MAKIRSRLLVVDASIASAAGDVSTHPTSRRCRDFLLAIREICHQIVMTAPIQQEWDKHQSRAWFKNARFRVTLGISARTLIGPALERVYATPG